MKDPMPTGSCLLRMATAMCVSACLVSTGCGDVTTTSPGFTKDRFRAIEIGSPLEGVIDSIGLPLDAWRVTLDADGPAGSNSDLQVTPVTREGLLQASRQRAGYLTLEYSSQGGGRLYVTGYISYSLVIDDGRVAKKVEAHVTE